MYKKVKNYLERDSFLSPKRSYITELLNVYYNSINTIDH